MKTMKLYLIATAMLAAPFLASCSNEDEDYDASNLVGTWLRDYDKGVVSEGYVEYTFSRDGECDIHVFDVFAGDTTIHRGYKLRDNRQLLIYEPTYGGASRHETWNIKKLDSSTMSWERTDHPDIIYNFRRAVHQK